MTDFVLVFTYHIALVQNIQGDGALDDSGKRNQGLCDLLHEEPRDDLAIFHVNTLEVVCELLHLLVNSQRRGGGL